MPRTTVNLDASILRALKRRAKAESKSLGQLISEIAAPALAARPVPSREDAFEWKATAGRLLVDIDDKEALNRMLDDG